MVRARPGAFSPKRKPKKAARLVKKSQALIHFERGERLLKDGRPHAAVKQLEAARDTVEKTETNLRAHILYSLAQGYMLTDKIEAMERTAEDLITFGHDEKNPEAEADGYLLFAKAQYLNDRAPVALTSLDCAEPLYREAKHTLGLAHTWRNRGDALYRLGRHEEALAAYAAAEPLYAEENEIQGLGNTLAARGDLLFFLGRNDEALFFLKQAQKFLLASGNDHAVGGCLLKLGAVHSFAGRTREALRTYNKAYRIFCSMEDERSLADTAFRRGELYFRIGDNKRAMRDLLEAIERHERSGDIHGRASALNSLAEVLLQLGRFEDCLDLATQAETLFIEIDDPMGRSYAVQNLAWAAYQLGRDAEALARSEEGATLARERRDQLGEANALATRARVLSRLGRDAEALKTYSEAAALYRIVGDPIGLSDMQSSSARIFRRQGDYLAALAACEEAEQLSRNAHEPLGLANTQATRGQILFAMGRIDDGNKAIMMARETYVSIDARWNVPQLDMELARQLSAANRWEDAREVAGRSLVELDTLRALDPSARTHADLVEQFADALVVLLDVLRRLERIDEMVVAMESRRSWTLSWLQSKEKSAPVSKKAPAVESSCGDERPSTSAIELAVLLDHIRVMTSSGAIVSAWYPFPLEGEERARCLLGVPGDGAKFLELELEEGRFAKAISAVLELGRTQQEMGWNGPLTELGSLVFGAKIAFEQTVDGQTASGFSTLRDVLHAFPNAPLVIVPQGLFGLIPWPALIAEGARHLVEERPVSLVPQFAHVSRSERQITRGQHERAFCFGLGSKTLHWTEREATDVATLLESHAYHVTTHIGRESSDRAFVKALSGCSIVHLATHAVFDAEDPFHSFLELSGSGASGAQLRLVDVLAHDFAGATAVLSACSTAVTDWKRVFDPVSLMSAFLAAGCEQVIGTLWEVDDASTTLLMLELYKLVLSEHYSWTDALREVQIRALRGEIVIPPKGSSTAVRGPFAGAQVSSRRRGLASPLRWGAFGLSRTLMSEP